MILVEDKKEMKRSKSQRALKLFSVIQFLNGLVFVLFFVILLLSMQDKSVYEQISKNKTDVIIGTAELLINAVILFVSSYILRRTSKDASLHNSALRITLIVIAYEIFNFITSLGVGAPRNFAAMVFTVIMNLIIVYFVLKVEEEYKMSLNQ